MRSFSYRTHLPFDSKVATLSLTRFDPWRSLRNYAGIDQPRWREVGPGPYQQVRPDFARKIFGKLFVGGLRNVPMCSGLMYLSS
jgi:hypothetical protein